MGPVDKGHPVTCYIALGSNQGGRKRHILQALEQLRQLRGVAVREISTLQETRPIGLIDQPDFLNAVAVIDTTLEPLELLDRLQAIEASLGRVRTQRGGPRSIDLDILMYGDRTICHPRLTIPHPEMGNRPFIQHALRELGVRRLGHD